MIGTYHNYFQEDMITVMAPVTGILYKGISDHSQPGLSDQRKMPHADGSGLYFSWSYFPVVLHLPAWVPFLLRMTSIFINLPMERADIFMISASLKYNK